MNLFNEILFNPSDCIIFHVFTGTKLAKIRLFDKKYHHTDNSANIIHYTFASLKYKKIMIIGSLKKFHVTNCTAITALLLALSTTCLAGEPGNGSRNRYLTLEECREMALMNDWNLKVSEERIRSAEYDRKTATSYFFPEISAAGTYMYNSRNLSLIDNGKSEALRQIGSTVDGGIKGYIGNLMKDPDFLAIMASDKTLQYFMQHLSSADIATPLNMIGAEIANAFTFDITNVTAAAITLKQPVFAGGKIVNSNRMAKLAEELAKSQYRTSCQETVLNVDQTYWQIISIANKVKLAEEYASMLHKMESDVSSMVEEGVATLSDELSIKVKANEADMSLLKARNGLALSKMLLCKLCGMDLASPVTLADEISESAPAGTAVENLDNETVFANRSEIRSLTIASEIYKRKIAIARADMMPQIAIVGNYFVTNPSFYNGFKNEFNGMFNAGIMIRIPIFHGFEAANKVNKAKSEATAAGYALEDAKEMIILQLNSIRNELAEAGKRKQMAESNLESAEENMRASAEGFAEGTINTTTMLAAHTAWMKAKSECIDAEIEIKLGESALRKAQGQTNIDL